jgi:hypothetical protein
MRAMPGPPFMWPIMPRRPRKPESLRRLFLLLTAGAFLVVALILGLSLF